MEIILDSREHQLIEEFRGDDIEITVKQLNIGDIVISYDSQIKIIFERKTISDLISSIKDGRHREQKFRMSEFQKATNCKIIYIYEGDLDFNGGTTNPSSVNGSFINTIFRDDIQIINTKNLKATKSFLTVFFNKIQKDPSVYFIKSVDSCVYNECVNKTKKKNTTIDNILINQIACIHGFSFKHAKAIQEHFKVSNMRDLINMIEGHIGENNKKDPLLEIKGIGKKMSSSFYEMTGIKI